MSTQYGHRHANSHIIRQSVNGDNIIMIVGVLAPASNIRWSITEHEIHGVQQRLPKRKIVLDHKLSEINIAERAYRVYRLSRPPLRLDPR